MLKNSVKYLLFVQIHWLLKIFYSILNLARNLRTSSKLPKLTSQPKSSPKNPAAQNLSAQVQQQQQLAQLQTQIAQLTSAMTMVFLFIKTIA
jgi:hypothetical protein